MKESDCDTLMFHNYLLEAEEISEYVVFKAAG
jgi:hypothetical protein